MKTTAFAHQIKALEKSQGKRNFAFLCEQGTGKTWITLADVERCFLSNKIEAFAVVAPNGVHKNWTKREIPTHLEIPTHCFAWGGTPTTKKAIAELEGVYRPLPDGVMRVFSINIEALNSKHGYEALERFLSTYKVMLVVDESTRIKNPQAKRTKKVIALGKLATARRILSGTPITKSPIDLYSQFDFLKSGLLGTKSYRAFVSEYAVLMDPHSPAMRAIIQASGARGVPQIVEKDANGRPIWKNLEQLSDMIDPHSYRVTKADCLDLPPKIYKTLTFELTTKQRNVYDSLKDDLHYVHEGEDMSFEAIATRTKLKQVTSGFINIYNEAQILGPDENPRLELFSEIIEDIDGQFIVWAMFELEILQVMEALAKAGISCVSYYGATSKDNREKAIDDFQRGDVTVFVGHAQAAGIGLTLTKAATTIYYSCSFDNELRLQSEDRNHRIGSEIHDKILYIDLVAEDTIDEDVVASLARKTAVANKVIDRQEYTY